MKTRQFKEKKGPRIQLRIAAAESRLLQTIDLAIVHIYRVSSSKGKRILPGHDAGHPRLAVGDQTEIQRM